MKDAIRQTHVGVVLDLEISPGAKETAVQGYNPWRKRIEVRLSERAQKGKANEQLKIFLSDLFHVNSRDVRIITGLANSKKSLLIIGAQMPDILKLLKENEHKDS
ncbi:MAG: YggU family protein [Euryarchaeota archaeon]|nr:YggU family protein [Euryarchaeota archaeon]MBU4139328.1 YggU family protein [Euryarchaeota archaeon]